MTNSLILFIVFLNWLGYFGGKDNKYFPVFGLRLSILFQNENYDFHEGLARTYMNYEFRELNEGIDP